MNSKLMPKKKKVVKSKRQHIKNRKIEKIETMLDKASYIIILTLGFLVPIFIVPITSEFYEFNKSMLLIVLSIILFIFGVWRFALTGKLKLLRSKLDLWIGLIVGSALISLILSKSFLTSLLGYSARLSEGFFVLVCLVFLGLLIRDVINDKEKVKGLILSLILGGSVLSLITILQFLGIYIFGFMPVFEFSKVRNFSLIGSTQVLPFYLLALFPIALTYFLSKSRDFSSAILAFIPLILIVGGFVISAGSFWSWPGIILWVLFILSLVFVLSKTKSVAKSASVWIIVLFAVLTLFFAVRNINSISGSFTKDVYTLQPTLSYSAAWNISASAMSESPLRGLVGNGSDSFTYSFNKYRPKSYNETSNWDKRFSRSSNQILEIMNNYGIAGLIVWVGFFVISIMYIFQLFAENHSFPLDLHIAGIGTSIIIIILSSLFVYYNISVWFLFWGAIGLLPALRSISIPRLSERISLSLLILREKISVEKQKVIPYIIIAPVILLSSIIIFQMQKLYRSDVFYHQSQLKIQEFENSENKVNSVNQLDESSDLDSEESNDGNNNETDFKKRLETLTASYNYANRASNMFEYRSDYFRYKSFVSIQVLKQLSSIDSNEIDEYDTERKEMVRIALKSSARSTEINTVDVRNWESRFFVYRSLLQLTNGDYGQAVYNSIQRAIQLDPVKPQLYHQAGIILSAAGEDQEALNSFKTAVELKRDFLGARYDLAHQYKKLGMADAYQAQLLEIKSIMETAGLEGSEAFEQIKEEIE
jgi:tetratricopeptide (TPR) repeat protein